MNWLGNLIQKEINPDDTILDLGCGIMIGYDGLICKNILGTDIWKPYLNVIKDKVDTIEVGMSETFRFMDNSYDVVICLDVIEHLDYDLAIKVLEECKRICRKKAIIYTPKEFKDNHQDEDGAWGLGDNVFQNHLCLVDKQDLRSRGYTTKDHDGWYGVYKS